MGPLEALKNAVQEGSTAEIKSRMEELEKVQPWWSTVREPEPKVQRPSASIGNSPGGGHATQGTPPSLAQCTTHMHDAWEVPPIPTVDNDGESSQRRCPIVLALP